MAGPVTTCWPCTVIVTDAVTDGLSILAAVMVTCVFVATWLGAVYSPVALIVPIGCAVQFTFAYGCPPRLAVNCCVAPGNMDAAVGLTLSTGVACTVSVTDVVTEGLSILAAVIVSWVLDATRPGAV